MKNILTKTILVTSYFLGVLASACLESILFPWASGSLPVILIAACIAGMKVGIFGEAVFLNNVYVRSCRFALTSGLLTSILDTLISIVVMTIFYVAIHLMDVGLLAILFLYLAGRIIIPSILSAAVFATMIRPCPEITSGPADCISEPPRAPTDPDAGLTHLKPLQYAALESSPQPFLKARSIAQHPRKCDPPLRQWARNSSLSHPAATNAPARLGSRSKARSS